jgi:hypothetical protein
MSTDFPFWLSLPNPPRTTEEMSYLWLTNTGLMTCFEYWCLLGLSCFCPSLQLFSNVMWSLTLQLYRHYSFHNKIVFEEIHFFRVRLTSLIRLSSPPITGANALEKIQGMRGVNDEYWACYHSTMLWNRPFLPRACSQFKVRPS